MNTRMSDPIVAAIGVARSLIPSVDELRAKPAADPFEVTVPVPAVLVHILVQEIERAHEEIERLEAMVMLAGSPGGTA